RFLAPLRQGRKSVRDNRQLSRSGRKTSLLWKVKKPRLIALNAFEAIEERTQFSIAHRLGHLHSIELQDPEYHVILPSLGPLLVCPLNSHAVCDAGCKLAAEDHVPEAVVPYHKMARVPVLICPLPVSCRVSGIPVRG